MKRLQIGVMGSAEDLKYSKETLKFAQRIGELIAQKDAILVFGAEKDMDSLSSAAARLAKMNGGITVGITYGKGQDIWDKDEPTIIIPCGLERGGGREFTLALACDAVIAIAGGSGTLTEMVVAYQANIPIVALTGLGGWSEKMADKYFDERKHKKCVTATTPEEAVDLAVKLAREVRNEYLHSKEY